MLHCASVPLMVHNGKRVSRPLPLCRKGLVLHAQHWRDSSASYWHPIVTATGPGRLSPPLPVNDVIFSPVYW